MHMSEIDPYNSMLLPSNHIALLRFLVHMHVALTESQLGMKMTNSCHLSKLEKMTNSWRCDERNMCASYAWVIQVCMHKCMCGCEIYVSMSVFLQASDVSCKCANKYGMHTKHNYWLDDNYYLKTRTLPIKPICLCRKHQNITTNQKVVLLVEPFFCFG